MNSKGNERKRPVIGLLQNSDIFCLSVIWPFKTDNSNLYDVNVESLKNELYGYTIVVVVMLLQCLLKHQKCLFLEKH